MKNIIKEITFLVKFGNIDGIDVNKFNWIRGFITIFFLHIISITICVIFKNILLNGFHTNINRSQSFLMNRENNDYYKVVGTIIISPIFEELRHRLCIRYSRLNFSILVGTWSYLPFKNIFKYFEPLSDKYYLFIELIFILIVSVTVNYILKISKKNNLIFKNFWINYPKLILFLLIFSFGFLHLYNYNLNILTLLLAPLITLPQIIGGFFFSYARLKYGIAYSILLHSMNNLFFTLLYLYGK